MWYNLPPLPFTAIHKYKVAVVDGIQSLSHTDQSSIINTEISITLRNIKLEEQALHYLLLQTYKFFIETF